jgi:PPP family 3-phenylpropionic acid transporter
MYAGALFLSILLISRVPLRARPRPSAKDLPRFWALLGEIARDRLLGGMAAAFSVMFLANIGRVQFEPVYLRALGASTSVIGLVNTVGALIEIPGLLWADRLVRRMGGRLMLGVSWLGTGASLGLLLAFPSIAGYFLFRIFNGFAFSLYTVSTTIYLPEIAPAGQKGTILALYTVTLRALLTVVGGPLNGWIFDTAGAYWLYVLAAVGYVIAWSIYAITGTKPVSKASTNHLHGP